MNMQLFTVGIFRCFNKISVEAKSAIVSAVMLGATAFVPAVNGAQPNEPAVTPEISFDGLELQQGTRSDVVYLDPNADFSVFRRIVILEPHVTFRRNWLRDQNRQRRRNLSTSDMDRIKVEVAALLKQVFTDRLTEAGYEVVEKGGDDVLILRPAIINLDVTAPDTRTPGRSQTFTTTTGSATLYLELFDSVSGNILGRAADRQTARSPGGMMSWSNSVINTADARRIFGRWADRLRDFLDTHYMKASEPVEEDEK